MTGSEHTTGALVCAALQWVGYQRPLPRDGRRLCPRQAYLTTRLIRPRPPYYPSLPTRPLDDGSNLLSTRRKSHAHTLLHPIPSHPTPSRYHPHPTWRTRVGCTQRSSQLQSTARGSQYGSPSRQSPASQPAQALSLGGARSGRFPIARQRLTARVLTFEAADPRYSSYLPRYPRQIDYLDMLPIWGWIYVRYACP